MTDYLSPWLAATLIALTWIALAVLELRVRALERRADATERRELRDRTYLLRLSAQNSREDRRG